MHTEVPRPRIDAALVERLVAAQFPEWSGLPVREVDPQGWDNRTYRLGSELAVRLPSAAGYVAAVEKEQRVLPYLAARLDVPVPEPVGLGVPAEGYPFPWSVRRWIDGTVAARASTLDRWVLAADVGAVLRQLRAVPAGDGPVAGAHSFHRGAHPSHYAVEVVAALDRLGDAVDRHACEAVWGAATASVRDRPAVWFHGDVAPGNLLVDRDGRLSAVLDFGTCGVGDPACDLVLAWTFLDPEARRVLGDAVGLDAGTWARARGWALWKALIMLAGSAGPGDRAEHEAVLRAVLADPVA
ncbi:aminoglycoside phosphotransferase (APT) family kinase protein [Curtobacterium luteum]|uniref:Aminoglycoside phosphotransferase n=1 Tax=Curtobacterium luteum TaxID=33881 RepID=A0A8H9GBM8_9MICO|nr:MULTISPECIES: aminoglycoside phosphotransferase family protein [Curtobacterium]MBM7803642.1 aminoglycoside phosphotransferase (APT) family kinase protein [Curtobacterium luteum]NUU50088.1 aminoglycoside phosphotransferase family protein [Curtobacterium luteum]GGK98966.1 aminoglycoside phosphotransferase [Curtobacterium luteum]